jgi:hypothetical protein
MAAPSRPTPRVLAGVGLSLTLLLWAAWVVFLIIKMSEGRFAWPLWVVVAVLVSWVPLFAVALLLRVARHGDVNGVGTYGAVLTLFGVPATFIGCPLALPGLVVVLAGVWKQRPRPRR